MKSIINVRLSETTDRTSNVSVLDLPGDILIVPQVSQWGGKMRLYWTPYVDERSFLNYGTVEWRFSVNYPR